MLKQLPSQNQRPKGFRVKHAFQICLLLAICIWLLYQVKNSNNKKAAFEERLAEMSLKEDHSWRGTVKLRRRDLPDTDPLEESRLDVEKQRGIDEVSEENTEESKTEETEGEGIAGEDEHEIDGNDQERAEDDESEDFVEEEDRNREENEDQVSGENGNPNEDVNLLDDDKGNMEEESSSSLIQNSQTVSSEEVGAQVLRRLKEENVDNSDNSKVRAARWNQQKSGSLPSI